MNDNGFALACPVPVPATETIQLAQGSGGRAMERLLDTLIRPAFGNPRLDRRHDGARLDLSGPIAFPCSSPVRLIVHSALPAVARLNKAGHAARTRPPRLIRKSG